MRKILIITSIGLFLVGSLAAYSKIKAEEKIDENIKNNVIILLKNQLLETPAGFEKFCKANSGKKRSVLRKEVIEKLKEIADKDQPAVLKALGNPKDAQPLWIVNAIMATLSPGEIMKASSLERVKYIYLGNPVGMAARRGPQQVSTVLEIEDRQPFSAEGKKYFWNLEMIGATQVWEELKVAGDGVVVAMLDAGVNYNHLDLKKNIWINTAEIPNNGKDDDENGYVDDYYGYNFWRMSPEIKPNPQYPVEHGSITSCIVAGDGTGGTITGVAPRAKIMPLVGPNYYASLAFQYALENGADVVNMSFSLADLGDARGFWRMMSDHAVCAGLVLVSGAGNFSRLPVPLQIRIPEGIPSVICAGGVDKDMNIPKFCSQGPVEWGSVKFYNDYPMEKGGLIKPDICGFPGPGYLVVQGGKDQGYIEDPNSGPRGNSFSSPHVSGVAALMLSANPDLPAWRIKDILEETATDLDEPGKDPKTGAGLANALKAVKKAQEEAR